MAKSIRFINRRIASKGQLMLALFLGLLIAQTAQAQSRLEGNFEQNSSSGFLKPAHWIKHPLASNDRTHWLMQRSSITAQYKWENWHLGIAREQQAYARANTAALQLAAQDKANHAIDLGNVGSFPLHAEVWKMSTSTLSATYAWKPIDTMTVEIETFLQAIHDFEHTYGDLLLVNSEDTSRLAGTVKKIGTRSYGYIPQDQADQGWGSGVNLRTHWEGPWGNLGLTILNAWNRQEFTSVHQMERQYNVTATGNKVNIADLPSVTGQYALTKGHTRLPVFWHTSYAPSTFPNLAVGFVGLGQQSAWTARYSRNLAQARMWIQTVEGCNWTAGYGRSLGSGWNAAFTVSTDAQGNSPLLSSVLIQKVW